MKQIDPNQIESPESQERRARERLRVKPVITCALIVAVIIFAVPAGGPWMSHEAFISAMGRLISHNWLLNLIGHFVLALVYGFATAWSVYRFRLGPALLLGAVVGLVLYALNYILFAALLGYSSNELHVGLEHLVFCLLFAAAYKAASVPRARWKGSGEPVHAE